MSDTDESATEASTEEGATGDDGRIAAETLAVSSNYKVLGQLTAASGIGVLGQNDAGSGTPVGVKGVVPNTARGYGLETPDDARVEGDLWTTGDHTVLVDGDRALFLGDEDGGDAGSVVAGHSSNTGGRADGATISGGGFDDGNTDDANAVYDDYGTVGGGRDNQAGSNDRGSNAKYATVSGGNENTATALDATVGGGRGNEVQGAFGTIAGGGPSDPNDLGKKNVVTDRYGTIGGGGNNQAGDAQSGTTSATYATVGGGRKNEAKADKAVVGGGNRNVASGPESTVGGGFGNDATDGGATVAGGKQNEASGGVSTVPGGIQNLASAFAALAAGEAAAAEDDNAFVWNDGSGASDGAGGTTDRFSSSTSVGSTPTGSETFSVKATGGVRFVTADDNSSRAWIDTSGNVKASGTKDFVETVETATGERTVTYTSVEAPTVRTEVSGVATVEDGYAEVDLPENFAWVTDPEEPLVAQVTAHTGDATPRVTERSTHRLVIRDAGDPPGAYEVSYTVKGTRDGHAEKQVVEDPAADDSAGPGSDATTSPDGTDGANGDSTPAGTGAGSSSEDLATAVEALRSENERLRERLAADESHLDVDGSRTDG